MVIWSMLLATQGKNDEIVNVIFTIKFGGFSVHDTGSLKVSFDWDEYPITKGWLTMFYNW